MGMIGTKRWQCVQARGHLVWVDAEKLTPGIIISYIPVLTELQGCDWEEGIASGLTWAKEAQENGRVLLLMTPHALRRPDGYCLNEIARATQLKLHIFPTLVCESEPPPAISMLPYFDLQDCVPSLELAQSLDQKSKEWQAAMTSHLNSPHFLAKSLKLFAMLEMCESITNNMVTLVAGVENLNLFENPQVQQLGRMPTYRKVLSPKHIKENPFTDSKRRESGHGIPIMPAEENRDASLATSIRYVFVFDATSAPLAMKLHADLTTKGFLIHSHCVPSPLLPHARRDAISWAESGKMILFLTPQSVGRPHGVCLNDISAAMSSNVGFVPLMIRQCEIPLSICRIQWLDLSDCLIDSTDGHIVNDAKYPHKIEQLITALNGKLDHDGLQARLFSLFAPFSFQTQISKYTQGFAGREWVLKELEEWKYTQDQVFWITGQIGSGKSALAAFIIQNHPEIRAFHLVCKEDEQTQSHRRCVLSLAYQLTTQLPEYASFLQQGDPLEEVVPVSTVAELVDILLIKPLSAIAQPATTPLVILVDGLDSLEDTQELQNCLVSTLPLLWQKLPFWVRLILTSREDPVVMRKLQGCTPQVSLDKCNESTKQDIISYLQKALLPYIPSSANGVVPLNTLQFIACRAEGLFLYASHIVNAIAQHRLTLDHLESFPTGMGGFLRQFFESQFSGEHFKEKIRPLLEVLCAAYEPLNLHILCSIMQWDLYMQHEMLGSFKSLLYVTDSNMLKPFHTSVLEWLQDSNAAGPFYARVEHGHERIGLWAWKEYSTVLRATTDVSNINFELEPTGVDAQVLSERQRPIYIIRHALNHLREANTEESIRCMQNFSSDEKFQLARRLITLRQSGLESFFHGDMDRGAAQSVLMKAGTPGAFLIRYSANQKSYCASFIDKIVDGTPQIKHNVIYHLESGAYSAVQPKDVQPTTPIYPDLLSFVEAYQRKGLKTIKMPVLTPEGIRPAMDERGSELLKPTTLTLDLLCVEEPKAKRLKPSPSTSRNAPKKVQCLDSEHMRQKTAKCAVCAICRFCPAGSDECVNNHRILRPMVQRNRPPRAKVYLCDNEEHQQKKTHRGKCERCLKCKWCPPIWEDCKEFHVDPDTCTTPKSIERQEKTARLESLLSILGIDEHKAIIVRTKDLQGPTIKRRQASELIQEIVQLIAELVVEKSDDAATMALLMEDLKQELQTHPIPAFNSEYLAYDALENQESVPTNELKHVYFITFSCKFTIEMEEPLDGKEYFDDASAPSSYVEALELEEDELNKPIHGHITDTEQSSRRKSKKNKIQEREGIYIKKVKCVDAEHVRQKTAKCDVCGICRFCPPGTEQCGSNHRILRPMLKKARAPRAKVLLCDNPEHHMKKTHRGKCVRCLKCKWCPPIIDECKEFHVDPETSNTPAKVEQTVKLESILSILDIPKGKLVQVKPRDMKAATNKRKLACELMTQVVHSVTQLIVEPCKKRPDLTPEGLQVLIDDVCTGLHDRSTIESDDNSTLSSNGPARLVTLSSMFWLQSLAVVLHFDQPNFNGNSSLNISHLATIQSFTMEATENLITYDTKGNRAFWYHSTSYTAKWANRIDHVEVISVPSIAPTVGTQWKFLATKDYYMMVRYSTTALNEPECYSQDGVNCVVRNHVYELLPFQNTPSFPATCGASMIMYWNSTAPWCTSAKKALNSCTTENTIDTSVFWTCTPNLTATHDVCESCITSANSSDCTIFPSVESCQDAINAMFLPTLGMAQSCNLLAIDLHGNNGVCMSNFLATSSPNSSFQSQPSTNDSVLDRVIYASAACGCTIIIASVWYFVRTRSYRQREIAIEDTMCSSCAIDDNGSSIYVRHY
ncbi:hypothetical protein THRCLA_01286 [Thraustotheca clavata]|uniref:SH2 domain-containing protein n=1 Tax=Thraustotheca clavata TaxID=74557 RepID=A0A1W0A8Y9_9STRA|nr:hypothetical protein THRCLA_01286 [Thraustotheca clavata]